ncbi:hypothetical protein [uncultured Duncaniella sp.]|nr:hypothetical protein [uncultured Duncaniella sp.]
MWKQRIYGLEYPCDSTYLLVCDDDVCFDDNYVASMMEMAERHRADALISIKDKTRSLPSKIVSAILGGRTESKKSKYKISINKTGSFCVNNYLKEEAVETQSAPFQCFLCRKDMIQDLHLKDEMWLDESPYALPDDQVFFFKAHCLGKRIFSTKKLSFTHLDGGSSSPGRRINSAVSSGRNYLIFWHRFLYSRAKGYNKLKLSLANKHRIIAGSIFYFAIGLRDRNLSLFKAYRKGVNDGYKFINSTAYTNLPHIK